MNAPLNDFDEKKLHLEEVVRRIKDLPTLPAVAQEMLNDLDDDEASLDTICEKVALDQALAAKTLRLANSSFYGANSKVVTIQQAVSMLGMKSVKNLIRISIVANSFPSTQCEGFDYTGFWRHSVATAICAELVSRKLQLKHDFAFTAGLLHDIGRLVLVTRFPTEYAQVLQYQVMHQCELLQAEQDVLGADHVIAGFVLAMHWQFSDAIQDAIRGHHEPDDPSLNSIAAIVHVANAIVHALDLAHDELESVPHISQFAWDSIALTEHEFHEIFRETELRFEALDQIVI